MAPPFCAVASENRRNSAVLRCLPVDRVPHRREREVPAGAMGLCCQTRRPITFTGPNSRSHSVAPVREELPVRLPSASIDAASSLAAPHGTQCDCAANCAVIGSANGGSGHHGTGLQPTGFRPEMGILGEIRSELIVPGSV